ncbi:gamma-glutamyl-gamma-aminobutyrate hydrolase family protein [Leeia sp. TBRC 13508]|uniref:Gamma-glutamyl-gamma-aminobutyrate hydrolase family protein n=1 Tax=Leeia speluncae TaxID=2884804 RepID=A0ABS8D9N0_9NEIS|nr:gamma-glutamyl-gamma-aminobutyrate hydrolase family protein [Leeia speluncae]MCB6184920.1 gamma-glutamyl-gamma-aminobutyrate hydrolase family protein [Leeia speluncae]
MKKPLVGIFCDRKFIGEHAFHVVGEKYISAVVGGGDVYAVLVPVLEPQQSLAQTLEQFDGIVFTGSRSNLEPRHYGGPASEPGTLHDPHRDANNMSVMKAAVAAGIPVLGICRGFQEMNVVFGGTLHQKVHEVPGNMDHREKGEGAEAHYAPSHEIDILPDSHLRQWYGNTKAMVNSVHSQGINQLGDGVTAEAVAPDGLVEAIHVKDAKTFAFAIQWHPEWQYQDNPLSLSIFNAFGKACHAYQASR